MSDHRSAEIDGPPTLGFRRRCSWCGVQLRGWQMNLCRLCKTPAVMPYAGPPCRRASRWGAAPDAWRWPLTPAAKPGDQS